MKYSLIYQNEAGEAGDAGAPPAPVADAAPIADAAPAPIADAPPSWAKSAPEDWRQQLAGDDEKRLNVLNRVKDFGSLADNYFNAQDKIRSGEISTGLPDDPTPEQLSAYREANNIPATAEDYNLKLDEGLTILYS